MAHSFNLGFLLLAIVLISLTTADANPRIGANSLRILFTIVIATSQILNHNWRKGSKALIRELSLVQTAPNKFATGVKIATPEDTIGLSSTPNNFVKGVMIAITISTIGLITIFTGLSHELNWSVKKINQL
jgi:hypothetical protein